MELTDDIKSSLKEKKKVGVVSIYLTATYDTVWQSRLTPKTLHVIPDYYVVQFFCEDLLNFVEFLKLPFKQAMAAIACFTSLKNEILQGSTISSQLFDFYIGDIVHT